MRPDAVIDPVIAQKVRDSFARQEAMRTIGATLAGVEPGRVEIALPAAPHVAQQMGFVHGGVVAMILDSACGYAAFTTMPLEAEIVSVEFKINFLRPAVGERIVARGEVVRAGRTLVVAQGTAVAFIEGRETAIAIMTATMAPIFP